MVLEGNLQLADRVEIQQPDANPQIPIFFLVLQMFFKKKNQSLHESKLFLCCFYLFAVVILLSVSLFGLIL